MVMYGIQSPNTLFIAFTMWTIVFVLPCSKVHIYISLAGVHDLVQREAESSSVAFEHPLHVDCSSGNKKPPPTNLELPSHSISESLFYVS